MRFSNSSPLTNPATVLQITDIGGLAALPNRAMVALFGLEDPAHVLGNPRRLVHFRARPGSAPR